MNNSLGKLVEVHEVSLEHVSSSRLSHQVLATSPQKGYPYLTYMIKTQSSHSTYKVENQRYFQRKYYTNESMIIAKIHFEAMNWFLNSPRVEKKIIFLSLIFFFHGDGGDGTVSG